MRWDQEAIRDLRAYRDLEYSMKRYKEQIKALESDFCSIQACATDRRPVKGGASRMEDHLVNNIARREQLAARYDVAKRRYDLITTALGRLDDQQRLVLERFFIHRPPNHVRRLCEELNVERSQIYRIKSSALCGFIFAMYGVSGDGQEWLA